MLFFIYFIIYMEGKTYKKYYGTTRYKRNNTKVK